MYHRHCHHHSQSPAFPFQPPHSSLTVDHTTANSPTHSTNNRNTYKNHHECQRKTITIQAAACLRLRLPSPYPCRSKTSNNKHHRRLLRHSRPRLHTHSMTGPSSNCECDFVATRLQTRISPFSLVIVRRAMKICSPFTFAMCFAS